ncbi:hypothetical protein OQ477_06790 [Bacillus sp. ChL18]|uniref:hypothetical protein n=1 Tax=Bacillus TaxID=1386 RepID=UPI00224882E6|nr:hypothetical protein [Bacillus sp. ChL18]MCX2809699.1 hypothetical protein [Bacillus sp. ChL18]
MRLSLLNKQYEMFRCAIDKTYFQKYKEHNEFDWVNFDYFRKLHYSKRTIRFNHVFPQTKKEIENWDLLVNDFCEKNIYRGQRLEKDIRSFLKFLAEKHGDGSFVFQLARHEFNIYKVAAGNENGVLDQFNYPITEVKDQHNSKSEKYDYLYLKEKKNVRVFKIQHFVSKWVKIYKAVQCVEKSWELIHKHLNADEKEQLNSAIKSFKNLSLLDVWKREHASD